MIIYLPPSRLGAVEPMSTPADFFDANWGYYSAAYHKGAIFLNQLRYITGEESFLERHKRPIIRNWSLLIRMEMILFFVWNRHRACN
jgi:hypothetical protein